MNSGVLDNGAAVELSLAKRDQLLPTDGGVNTIGCPVPLSSSLSPNATAG